MSQSFPVALSRTVDLQGPVHFVDYGGQGPTVVMVHGLGGCHLNWLPAAPLLARHARVLALDLLGFGHTPAAGRGVGVLAQQAMLGRFLAEVVGGPAVLMGNSLGGLVALAQAARGPGQVSGLVLVSPAQPPAPGVPLSPRMAARFLMDVLPGLGEYRLWRDGRRTGARGLFLDMLRLGCVDARRVPAEVVDANVALIAERMGRMSWAHAASYLQGTRSLLYTLLPRGRFDAWARAVQAPTLLVHGRQDRLVSLRDSEHLARLRPDWCFAPLDDVGHVPQMEDAPRFVARVVEWLEGTFGRGSLTPPAAAPERRRAG